MEVHRRKKDSGLKFRPGFILLFIVASFAGCFALYMKSEEEDTITKDLVEKLMPSQTEAVEEEPEEAPPVTNPVGRSERADDDYFSSCAFIGDSSVMGFFSHGIVEYEKIFLIEDLNDLSVLAGVHDKDDIKNIYLFFSPDTAATEEGRTEFGDAMVHIAEELRNGGFKGDIYIVSVLPESTEAEKIKVSSNTDIDKLNSLLLSLATEHRIYFIDENTYFKGADGRLKSSYVDTDGISMTENAYNASAEMIRTHTAKK